MAVHVIPDTEPELHIEDDLCPCNPDFMLDKETGEMVWAHKYLDPDRLFEDFIKI